MTTASVRPLSPSLTAFLVSSLFGLLTREAQNPGDTSFFPRDGLCTFTTSLPRNARRVPRGIATSLQSARAFSARPARTFAVIFTIDYSVSLRVLHGHSGSELRGEPLFPIRNSLQLLDFTLFLLFSSRSIARQLSNLGTSEPSNVHPSSGTYPARSLARKLARSLAHSDTQKPQQNTLWHTKTRSFFKIIFCPTHAPLSIKNPPQLPALTLFNPFYSHGPSGAGLRAFRDRREQKNFSLQPLEFSLS